MQAVVRATSPLNGSIVHMLAAIRDPWKLGVILSSPTFIPIRGGDRFSRKWASTPRRYRVAGLGWYARCANVCLPERDRR